MMKCCINTMHCMTGRVLFLIHWWPCKQKRHMIIRMMKFFKWNTVSARLTVHVIINDDIFSSRYPAHFVKHCKCGKVMETRASESCAVITVTGTYFFIFHSSMDSYCYIYCWYRTVWCALASFLLQWLPHYTEPQCGGSHCTQFLAINLQCS